VVEDKAPRVANFHRNTMRALAEVLGAAGVAHPQDLMPWRLHIRHQSGKVVRGDEVFPPVAANALILGTADPALMAEWRKAKAESFEAAVAA
jgi:hypothetical protein